MADNLVLMVLVSTSVHGRLCEVDRFMEASLFVNGVVSVSVGECCECICGGCQSCKLWLM